jgi:hypothetical protein
MYRVNNKYKNLSRVQSGQALAADLAARPMERCE